MQDSKEHILKTAFSLFIQKSFKEVTMKEIVEKTGLSKGAFYHYFESKEQLFLEVIDFYLKDLMRIDYEAYSHKSLWEFCEDYMADMMKKLNKAKEDGWGDDANYYFMIFDGMKLFPEFRKKIGSAQEHELQAWMEIVKIARKKGEIKSKMSDEQIARFFIFSNDGVGIRLILDGSMSQMAQELRELWLSFYKELKK